MKDTASTFASYGDDSVDLNENKGYVEEITDEENFNEGSHDEANDLGENESFDFTANRTISPISPIQTPKTTAILRSIRRAASVRQTKKL